MTLNSGTLIGHYEILKLLGTGGMGEVYLAKDVKLQREVAIKVLPPTFSNDPDRLMRFEREARLLASLNHPNIAAIYGLEHSDNVHFLVLELVPGETLAERLQQEALSVEEAVDVHKQIAEALEAAHKKGIIHRDLKPANVKVTPEGKVKVLDFGLAKAYLPEKAADDMSQSPTATFTATEHGVILGTAPYMSPEQARGKGLDTRTDIWSFGCVLYESLAGHSPFQGETVSDVIARILQREVDWEALPADVPGNLLRLLRRCLQKDADQRLQHIGDARIELQEAREEPAPTPALSTRSVPKRIRLWTTALVLVTAIILLILFRNSFRSPSEPLLKVQRFAVTFSGSAPLAIGKHPSFVLSPDGTQLVYVGRQNGYTQLFLRNLDDYESLPVPDTQGAVNPFFSTNEKSVGFFTGYQMKKVTIPLGPAQTLMSSIPPTNTIRGASWDAGGRIVFSASPIPGLLQTSSHETRSFTPSERGIGQQTYRWPEILPGSQKAITTTLQPQNESFEQGEITLLDLKTGQSEVLIRNGYNARLAPTGHLVFVRSNTLLAVPFDLSSLKVSGEALPVLDDLETNAWTGAAYFSFSKTGTLAFLPVMPTRVLKHLIWIDRQGKEQEIISDERDVLFLSLSQDGQRLAVVLEGAHGDIWFCDTRRAAMTRFTFGGSNILPSWEPNDQAISFLPAQRPNRAILLKAADSSKNAEEILTSDNWIFPGPWSPDGKLLAYVQLTPATMNDIYLLPRGGKKPTPFANSPYNETEPVFSPDGQWIAYVSNESGRTEVYLRPIAGEGPKVKLSTDGGSEIRWPGKSNELFYRSGTNLMAVQIQTKPTLKAGIPYVVFEDHYERSISIHGALYDVTPDGRRFLMVKTDTVGSTANELRVVLNWFEELKNLVPTKPD